MTNRLTKTAHAIVISSLVLIVIAIGVNKLDMMNRSEGELGYSLGLAFVYFLGLVLGFIGWLLAIIILVRQRDPLVHKVFALIYIIIGLIGFSVAYYFMQAS